MITTLCQVAWSPQLVFYGCLPAELNDHHAHHAVGLPCLVTPPIHARAITSLVCRRDAIVSLTSSAGRGSVKRRSVALAAVLSSLSDAGVNVGNQCGLVLSSSQTHVVAPDRLNRAGNLGLTAMPVSLDEHAAAWQPFEDTRQQLLLPGPADEVGAANVANVADLTPGAAHMFDKHPRWYAEAQVSMLLTNCTVWCLGLHCSDQAGATMVTTIRFDRDYAAQLQSQIEVAMAVVATMAILLPVRATARPGECRRHPFDVQLDGHVVWWSCQTASKLT